MAKYVPYCSVEIKFGTKEDLRAIVNDCGPDKKVLVVCEKFCTDMWELTADIEKNCAETGASFEYGDDRNLVKGADFIYTDVWYGLYENEMPKEERVRVFHDYQVNRELMQLGNIGCKFLHCLPATRGEEVTDEVADSDSSLCWEQAGNRLTAMRGLLVYFTRCCKGHSELQIAAAKEELDRFLCCRLGK